MKKKCYLCSRKKFFPMEMTFELLSAKEYGVSLKATIQGTGKLGFTAGTAKVMKLGEHSHVHFARMKEQPGMLYMALMTEADDDGFRVLMSGGYYYLNTKSLFDALGVDYRTQTVIYDLTRMEEGDEALGGKAYRMEPRVLPRKPKSDEPFSEDEE